MTSQTDIAERAARRGWTLAITSVAFFMVTLDALVVMTALPHIRADLHAGLGTLEWTVNAYTLTLAAGIVIAAALGDRFGRRRLFVIGLAVFTLASAGCALAESAAALAGARAVQGAGAAAVTPLSLTLLTSAFPAAKRGAIVGVWGGLAGVSVAGGPVIGGAITQNLSWHWIFWINVPIGVFAVLAARLRLTESGGPRRPLDVLGAALVTATAGLLVWGLIRASSDGWSDAVALVALASGVVLGIAATAHERRAASPVLPPALFRSRGFTAAVSASFLMTAALMAAVFLTTQYFQGVLGLSPIATGVRLLPWTATPLVIAPLAGAVADRVGARWVLSAGLVLQAAGLLIFAVDATVAPSYLSLCLPLLTAGVGVSMALPTAPTAALSAVPPAAIGSASGVSSTMQRFGGAFGIAIASAVFATRGGYASDVTFVAGFRPAIAVCAGMSLMGAVAGAAVARRRPAEAPESERAAEMADAAR